MTVGRSQWPRGLRTAPAATRWLGLQVRIPPKAYISVLWAVSVVFCQVEVYALDWSLVQRSPADCVMSECDREALVILRPWPTGRYCAVEKKKDD